MYICINNKYIYLTFIIYFITIKCKFIFNFSGGLRNCGIGGLIGFSLATVFSLVTSKNKIKEIG